MAIAAKWIIPGFCESLLTPKACSQHTESQCEQRHWNACVSNSLSTKRPCFDGIDAAKPIKSRRWRVWPINASCRLVADYSSGHFSSCSCDVKKILKAVTAVLQLHCESKNKTPNSCPQHHQILTDFQHSFTVRLSRKFVIKLYLHTKPHPKRVATLPCEISVQKIAILKE